MSIIGICRGLIIVSLSVAPQLASADVILDWNERGDASVTSAKQQAPAAARSLAIMHVAMFDAVNAIEQGFAAYGEAPKAAPGSSAEAAAIAAAHAVLATLFPEQQAALDEDYRASLSKVPGGPGKEAGAALGAEAAAGILAKRAKDGATARGDYRPETKPGAYVVTALPLGMQWGAVTPWAMASGSQFRPASPPDLHSELWARDYNEIKDQGGKVSRVRTAAQTDLAKFFQATGPVSWDPVVRALAASPDRSLIANARLFALVQIAANDAIIAVFDAKYRYNFWRPLTAIRNGDRDGNEATDRVVDWEPLIETPMHPEYPCAHCIISSAIGVVLEAELGAGKLPAIEVRSPSAPGVVERWTRIKDYVDDVAAARIYGGLHYRNSAEVGQAMGRQIGALVAAQQLRPIHRSRPKAT